MDSASILGKLNVLAFFVAPLNALASFVGKLAICLPSSLEVFKSSAPNTATGYTLLLLV